MSERRLADMLMVMDVALRGERVQYVRRNIQDAWKDIPPGFTEWNWALYDYRVAPEPRKPRECYAVFSDGSEHVRMFAHRDRNEASAHYRVLGGDEVVHMREVLPGDVVPITPKRDAVIIQFIDGKRVISIECANSEALPHLEREAQMILHS
jgi:hypothetical protein